MNYSDQEYVMIGSPIITKEIFRNLLRPLNNYSFKPSGGFWSAKYLGGCMHISDWYDYLEDADFIAMQKNLKDGVVFKLKKDTKVLTISTKEDIKKLAKKYPSYHHILNYNGEYPNNNNLTFDFEELKKEYDALYVNYNLLYNFLSNNKIESFKSWSINTMLLLNLDCIDYYKTIEIVRDKIEATGRIFIYAVDINKDKKVQPLSPYYKELYKLVEEMFLEKISTNKIVFKNYDEYLTNLVQITNECIKLIRDNHLVTNIKDVIKDEGGKTEDIVIRRNLVLNYLSYYLNSNKEAIKKLERVKYTNNKSYPID